MVHKTIFSYIDTVGKVQSGALEDILSLSEKSLLYFYPKNDTPGCTIENKDFTCLKENFNQKGIQIIGISKDSIESHEMFREKHKLSVIQLSDPELILHKYFGAYGEKNNYGKIITGVIRSTFLLDKSGNILKFWKNVKAKGHAEKILNEV
ncbi:peroxiredoxin [Candidatus Gracilibacteria bacterium]|nr:peroxiredoxin [Candidatus Gracilibacteria bacterium]